MLRLVPTSSTVATIAPVVSSVSTAPASQKRQPGAA
jgi:hypothetical protein